MDDHGEGADVHEGVGRKIEHGGGGSDIRMRGQRDQDVAGMGDGAIGQHALEIVCVSAAKLPMVIESSADIQTRGSQPEPMRLEGGHEDAQEDGEGGGFGSGGQEGG